MSKMELEQTLKDIIALINEYVEKFADAMCNGDTYHEQLYLNKIKLFESQREEVLLALQ